MQGFDVSCLSGKALITRVDIDEEQWHVSRA
jgi:hypothetical protein